MTLYHLKPIYIYIICNKHWTIKKSGNGILVLLKTRVKIYRQIIYIIIWLTRKKEIKIFGKVILTSHLIIF